MGFGYGRTTSHSQEARDLQGNRAKSVFDNSMVAHIWAQQVQDFGRSSNGNFYFEGATLYSYGTHYAVGHILPGGIALLNADSNSVTTGQHKGEAWGATSHLRRYRVPNLTSLIRPIKYLESDLGRDVIKAHFANWIRESDLSGLDSETVSILCGLFRYPVASWNKIRREVDKAATALAAKRAKRFEADKLALAVRVADMSESDWQDMLRENMRRSFDYGRFKLDLARAHKVAGKLSKTRRAKLWARLKETRAMVNRAEWLQALPNRRNQVRQYIKKIRTALHDIDLGVMNAESLAWDSNALGGLTAAIASLYNYGDGLTQSAKDRLETLRAGFADVRQTMAAQEQAERLEAEKEKREAWLAGENVGYFYSTDATGGAYIRATGVERGADSEIVSGQLETSKGAQVPLTHAIKAFRFIKLVRERGKPWQRNGQQIRVGHFSVDRIESDGSFSAACHTFNWSEIERLACQLGVFDLPASDAAISK
jgi:hypothetical protein